MEDSYYYSSISAAKDLIHAAATTFNDIDPWADRERDYGPDAARILFEEEMHAIRTKGFKSTLRGRSGRRKSSLKTKRSLVARTAHRFFIGLSAVGSLGFVQLMFSMAFFPLRIGAWLRRRRRRDEDGASTVTMIVIFVVAVGLAKYVSSSG